MSERIVNCRSCGDPMVFVRSAKDPTKSIPVNAEAAIWVRPGGSYDARGRPDPTLRRVIVTNDGRIVSGRLIAECDPDKRGCERGRRAHFATCPYAAAHRKPKAASTTT
jgi:hypothetical protein